MSAGAVLLAGAIGAVSLLAIAWCVITGAVVSTVLSLSPPGPSVEPADPDEAALERIGVEDAWAQGRGFDWAGAYVVNGQVTLAVWRRNAATFLVLYLAAGRAAREIVTVFSDSEGLTTTSERSAAALPRAPGAHLQIFPEADAETLLGRHEAGVEHLGRAGVSMPRQRAGFETVFVRAVHRQMAHVRGQPLWAVRCALWYLRSTAAPVDRAIIDQVELHELRRAA